MCASVCPSEALWYGTHWRGRCTHLGCVVYYKPEEATLYCPCHHGFFDPDSGQPTAGPPDRPLAAIDVEVRGDTVWALGIDS
jgi:arsenite oxidase small subunit